MLSVDRKKRWMGRPVHLFFSVASRKSTGRHSRKAFISAAYDIIIVIMNNLHRIEKRPCK